MISSVFDSVHDTLRGVLTSSWVTCWSPEEELRNTFPPRHSDFRDTLPPQMQDVVKAYSGHVKDGLWSFGLLEMWNPKAKFVKHAVHVPCWDSFRVIPWHWRGICFGRTLNECFWTGFRQMRWARSTYAGALGREYVMPVYDVGHHGYISDIKALFGLYCAMTCAFSCGIGQILSLCGNLGCNFGAWYSCHAREKLRHRYGLPSAFCMPPGIDDFLVHFFCMYCASHQEMREMAVRGVDGPGLHILDVSPESWRHLPHSEDAFLTRKAIVQEMTSRPPRIFRTERIPCETTGDMLSTGIHQGFLSTASNTVEVFKIGRHKRKCSEIGWALHCCESPPEMQTMQRSNSDLCTGASPFTEEALAALNRSSLQGIRSTAIGNRNATEDPSIRTLPMYHELPSKAWTVAF